MKLFVLVSICCANAVIYPIPSGGRSDGRSDDRPYGSGTGSTSSSSTGGTVASGGTAASSTGGAASTAATLPKDPWAGGLRRRFDIPPLAFPWQNRPRRQYYDQCRRTIHDEMETARADHDEMETAGHEMETAGPAADHDDEMETAEPAADRDDEMETAERKRPAADHDDEMKRQSQRSRMD